MPEIPELEILAGVLNRRIVGERIERVSVLRPIVLRILVPGASAESLLAGMRIRSATRQGKLLLLELEEERWIVINFMLAGWLRFRKGEARASKRDYLILHLTNGMALCYHDPKGMGKIYLLQSDLSNVPGYANMGPDALDADVTVEDFLEWLRQYRGEIKGVLTRGALVAGIGNAYADEILFSAGIYPFRKCSTLSSEERRSLFAAMRRVLQDAIAVLVDREEEVIEGKVRDFLMVHGKKGEPCPRCGHRISEIKVERRATNFCRHCQPGTLLRQ